MKVIQVRVWARGLLWIYGVLFPPVLSILCAASLLVNFSLSCCKFQAVITVVSAWTSSPAAQSNSSDGNKYIGLWAQTHSWDEKGICEWFWSNRWRIPGRPIWWLEEALWLKNVNGRHGWVLELGIWSSICQSGLDDCTVAWTRRHVK